MATIPPPSDYDTWAGTGTHADPLGQRGDDARHKAGVALVGDLTPPDEAPASRAPASPPPVTVTQAVNEGGRWRRRVT